MTDTLRHAMDIVRSRDPDRYLADLLAPAPARPHLFALHAFAAEVADIRWRVTEPTLGEIRIRWWEDAIRGDHGGNPVAAALAATIGTFGLPLGAFDNLLQARVFDLYDDPMPSVNDLEGYAGDVESALMQLGAMILAGGRDPGTAALSGLAGVATAITRILGDFPRNAAAGQTFLPADLLARHGAALGDVRSASTAPAVVAALADLRALARRRLAEAQGAAAGLDRSLLPAFLPAATAGLSLDRMERRGFDPLRDSAAISPFRRQWTLWRAARTGRI